MGNIEEVESNKHSDINQWFVMAPIYYQECAIKSYLESKNIRCYLPTKVDVKLRCGKKQMVEVPAVNGLLFVYSTENDLKEICATQPYLYYKYDREGGNSRKMIIPQKQMEDFLRVSSLTNKDIIYFDPKEVGLKLEEGIPVRLHSSNPTIDGVEGVYIKIKGKRNKRLVISLNNVRAVAMLVDVDVVERL